MLLLTSRWFYKSVGGLGHTPDHTRLEIDTNKGELGLYIDGVPELVVGEVAEWALKAGVDTDTRIPGYWQHDTGKSSPGPPLMMGEPPRAGSGEKYVLLHLHGGGYVVESAHPTNGTSSIPRAIMAYAPSIYRALAPEYRKAKQGGVHPFPAQLIDALAAYVYLIRTVGFRAEQVVVSGDSAGGNLALALTRYVVSHPELGVARPGALVLLSPWGDLTSSYNTPGSSYETNAGSDFLRVPKRGGEGDGAPAVFAGALTVHGHAFLSNKYISPAATTCGDWEFEGFPRTYVSVGGAEVFYDMNLELARRMRRDVGEENVVVGVMRDAWHDFVAFEWWKPERETAAREIAEWIESESEAGQAGQ